MPYSEEVQERFAFNRAAGYIAFMQAKIEKIGDQFGLMLPSELVRACGFGSEATVTLRDKKLVVTASRSEPREGWAEAVRAIPQEELDQDQAELQPFRDAPHAWNEQEWKWPASDSNEKI